MNTSKELSKVLFSQSENNIFHDDYEKELMFFTAVKEGDIETVKKLMTPLNREGLGVLSKNPIHNLRYHVIITIALVTRFCMEGEMPPEIALTLSDLYIRKVDILETEKDIALLHKEYIMDVTNRMHDLRNKKINSKIILKAVDYIHSHIHFRMRGEDIADYVHVHPNYLSVLFKKEMGVTMSFYIQKIRVEAAKNLLQFSEYTYSDISNYLQFNSHSRFINIFKKHTGMTPREYRLKYYRSNWNSSTTVS